MRAYNIYDDKRILHKEKNPYEGSTAWHIFDKDNIYPFRVDRINFKMKNGTHNFSMVHEGNNKDLHQLNISLVPVMGTIIEMSDYYNDGACISIDDPEVALTVYKRILKHLEAHLRAMQTDIYYQPPNDDTLKELSEFATAIRFKAMEADPNIDNPDYKFERVNSLRGARSFIGMEKKTISVEVNKTPPKSIEHMDAIEKYLAILEGN